MSHVLTLQSSLTEAIERPSGKKETKIDLQLMSAKYADLAAGRYVPDANRSVVSCRRELFSVGLNAMVVTTATWQPRLIDMDSCLRTAMRVTGSKIEVGLQRW